MYLLGLETVYTWSVQHKISEHVCLLNIILYLKYPIFQLSAMIRSYLCDRMCEEHRTIYVYRAIKVPQDIVLVIIF